MQVGDDVPINDRGSEASEILLYRVGNEPIRIKATWRVESPVHEPTTRRPRFDLSASRVSFGDPAIGALNFTLFEHATIGSSVLIELRPVVAASLNQPFPPRGVRGTIELTTSTAILRLPARLIVGPETYLVAEAVDEGDALLNTPGAFQVHGRYRDVRLRLQIRSRIPVWLLRAGADIGDAKAVILGLDCPLRCDPDHPIEVELQFDNSEWSPGVFQWFDIPVEVANLAPWSIKGRVRLGVGRPLIVEPEAIHVPKLSMGRIYRTALSLVAGDSPEQEGGSGLELADYRFVRDEPEASRWIRVVSPGSADLPMAIPTRSDDHPSAIVVVEIDTTRLNRVEYSEARLSARLDLIDQHRRRWSREILVVTSGLDRLEGPVAIDWGTTNSCAAYRTGEAGEERPREIALSEIADRPEEFPSEIYFVDAADRDDPKFLIGHDATIKSAQNPLYCLRSLKRRFQLGRDLDILDERGQITRYPVGEIVRHVLRRLILIAESRLNLEIRDLGLTFPTKWTSATRARFEEVAQALADSLESERGLSVTVAPPSIDEANAVAIQLLTSGEAPDLDRYQLIAYDFGGGTIDTSVLEVYYDDTQQMLKTEYIGLGGVSTFGGDEVTRALMMLLVDRLCAAMTATKLNPPPGFGDGAVSTSFDSVPLATDNALDDNLPPEVRQFGVRNWSILWSVADQIKVDLCAIGDGEDDPNGMADIKAKSAEAIRNRLANAAKGVTCFATVELKKVYNEESGGSVVPLPETRPFSLNRLLDLVHDALAVNKIWDEVAFTLKEVYDHEIDDIEGTFGGRRFKVRDRIANTVDELVWQCREEMAGRPIDPKVIILAGGGCHLPLVTRLILKSFPGVDGWSPLRSTKGFFKRRVAHGMANYLYLRARPGVVIEPARSVNVLHHYLGVDTGIRVSGNFKTVFWPIVRAGAPIHDPSTWYPFPQPIQPTLTEGKFSLSLFLKSWLKGSTRVGTFDFSQPVESSPGDPRMIRATPPFGPSTRADAEIRLLGLTQIEARVRINEQFYGPFAMIFDPDVALQG